MISSNESMPQLIFLNYNVDQLSAVNLGYGWFMLLDPTLTTAYIVVAAALAFARDLT